MNKLLIVNYGADEKNSLTVTEGECFRIINCMFKGEYPGFFQKTRIKSLSRGYHSFDIFGISCNILQPVDKGLFRRDISNIIKNYGYSCGVDFSKCELAVYGGIDTRNLFNLSEMFSMIWLFGNDPGDYHNCFEVRKRKSVNADVCIYADTDFDPPATGVVFNLTDIDIHAINDIEIYADVLSGLPRIYRNEAVRLMNMRYDIVTFIK